MARDQHDAEVGYKKPPREHQFKPGQSGNPSGRPPGTRNRRTIAAEMLFDEDAEALTRIAIDLAKEGDMAALRLCMDRVCPPTRQRPVSFELPQIANAADAVGAMSTIVQAIADGELSPSEAAELAKVVQRFAQTVKTADIDKRLALGKYARRLIEILVSLFVF